jgi:hypothetical protein
MDATIFIFGLFTFALFVGGLAFTIYEMRRIANRPVEKSARVRLAVTPATRVDT